jgi:hypothetical protein
MRVNIKKFTRFTLAILLIVITIAMVGTTAMAGVTAPTGGTNIPGTRARNGTSPAMTSIGNIVYLETGNGSASAIGTIILTASSNWRFDPSGVSLTGLTGFAGSTVAVSSDSLKIIVTIAAETNNQKEGFTIAGVQVMAVDGSITSSVNIVRNATTPGSARLGHVINGITNWGTLSSASVGALPVELTSFNAIAKSNAVELAWKTATEINNFGFDVEKNVSGSWSKIGFVEGNGTTNAPKNYNFVDAKVSVYDLVEGTVSYRLKQIDRDGKFEYSKTVETTVATPAVFALGQNYPNPFNPTTNISFSVPSDGMATLTVYNAIGQQVATLYNGVAVAGRLNVATFNASQLSSGVYFSRLTFSGKQLMNKMLLQK